MCAGGLLLTRHTQLLRAQAVEDQAINRVHRLGQTRRVLIKRLLAPDTVEDTMLELQVRATRHNSGAGRWVRALTVALRN